MNFLQVFFFFCFSVIISSVPSSHIHLFARVFGDGADAVHRWRCCLQQQRGFAIFFLLSWQQILLEVTIFGDCFFGLLLPVLLGSRWTMMSSEAAAAPLPLPPNFLWLLCVLKVSETSRSVVVVVVVVFFLYGIVKEVVFSSKFEQSWDSKSLCLSVCTALLSWEREAVRRESTGSFWDGEMWDLLVAGVLFSFLFCVPCECLLRFCLLEWMLLLVPSLRCWFQSSCCVCVLAMVC